MGGAASMVRCPSCGRPQEARLVCAECGAPLTSKLDYFAALGLPHKLQIDTAKLQERYHELGRRIHPDRFAASSIKLKDASMRATALLTRAYRTLRDPVSRGLYWLELNGRKLAEDNQQVPADLAAMVFEVQEQLEELREARAGDADSAQSKRAEVTAQREQLRGVMDALAHELENNFARWDTANGHAHEALFAELKATLSKLAYMRTLLRDVEKELDSVRAD